MAAAAEQQRQDDHAELLQGAAASGPAPKGKPASGTLATGTVKWYDTTRKFGFIMSDMDDTDLFMHHQELVFEPEDSQQLVYKLQRVQFTYSWDGERARAKQVTQIGGKPLPSHPSLANPAFQQRLKENPNIRTGVIKWYNPDKGYGFIIPTEPVPTPGSGELQRADVFVHNSRITCMGPRAMLTDRSPVEFELEEGGQAPAAAAGANPKIEAKVVTGPGGSAIPALPPGMTIPRGATQAGMAAMIPGAGPVGAAGMMGMAPAAMFAAAGGKPPGMVAAGMMPGAQAVGMAPRGAFGAPVMPVVNPYAGMPAAAAAVMPQPRIVSGPRYQGPVKWYSAQKGFGFIMGANEEEDLFMHSSSLIANDPKNVEIVKGQIVEYEITIQNGQQRAANVTLPNGLKLDDPQAAPMARANAVPPPQDPARVGSKRRYSATFGSAGGNQQQAPPQPGYPGAAGAQVGFGAGDAARYSKAPRQAMYGAMPQQAPQQQPFPAQPYMAAAAAQPQAAYAAQPQAMAAQQAQFSQYYHPYAAGDAYDNQYA